MRAACAAVAVACATCQGAPRPQARLRWRAAGLLRQWLVACCANHFQHAAPLSLNPLFTLQDVDALYVSHIQVNKAQKGRRRCVPGDPTFL